MEILGRVVYTSGMGDEPLVIVPPSDDPPPAPAASAETTGLALAVGATGEKVDQANAKADAAIDAATAAVAAASTPPPPPPAPTIDEDAIANKVLEKLAALAPPPPPTPPAPEPKPADEPPTSRKNRAKERRGLAARYYGK